MKNKEIYLITDTHFGHSKMEEWSLRPSDFNEKLWKVLESIPENSILIHLGDITIGSDATVHMKLPTLPYKKWLIRGNHDNHSIAWYTDNGWDCVCDEMVIDMYGHKILLSHEPKPKREGITKNVHGHLHGGKSRSRPDFYDEEYNIEICPEVVGYNLVKLGNVTK